MQNTRQIVTRAQNLTRNLGTVKCQYYPLHTIGVFKNKPGNLFYDGQSISLSCSYHLIVKVTSLV